MNHELFHKPSLALQRAWGSGMQSTRGKHTRNSRITTEEANDWLARQLRRQSSKHIAAKSGISPRTAEALRLGRHGLKFAHLIELTRNDPEFRVSFFKFCGGHVEGEPELVAAISHVINEVVRNKVGT